MGAIGNYQEQSGTIESNWEQFGNYWESIGNNWEAIEKLSEYREAIGN